MDHHATVPARPEPVRRVLLVEDHDAYRKVVALALTRFLPRVLVMEAGTAEDAAALVIDEAIDCLVSDFSLPDGTAMDLLNRVPASILQGLRVIVFSNHSQSVMEPLLRTHDIFTCISKEHGLKRLAQKVAEALDKNGSTTSQPTDAAQE